MLRTDDERILELLEALIVLRKIKPRDLEDDLGLSAGTIRRILTGKIELKLHHITDILAVLDIPPGAFFKIAYETEDPAEARSQLARAHRIAHFEPRAFDSAELEAVVVATLKRLGLKLPSPQEESDLTHPSLAGRRRRPSLTPKPKQRKKTSSPKAAATKGKKR